MDKDEAAAPEFRRAAEGLELGLETCHKIIKDYRSKLLSIEQPSDAPVTDASGGTTAA